MIVEWAHPDLAPRIVDLDLRNNTRSAGESISGFEQVAEGINQRWTFRLDFNNLKRSLVPAYRAMKANLRGRANVLRVPVFDSHFWPSDELIGLVSTLHSDDTPFSDGSEYVTNDVADLTVDGTRGEKTIEVDFGDYGEIFEAGLYFGIDDETYIATSVEWEGTVATIGFEPGLRQDHTGGQFRLRPWLIMRLATDESGSHPLEYGLTGSPSLALEEVLPDELLASEVA